MRLLGSRRINTAAQDARLQIDALRTAGVEDRDIFSDTTSALSAAKDRPGMSVLLAHVRGGNTVVVWRIDAALPPYGLGAG